MLAKGEITENNLLGLMAGKHETKAAAAKTPDEALSNQVVLKTSALRVWPNGEPVDFDLCKGEIIGITGLEGHGQDSFVRILAGVAQAEESCPVMQSARSTGHVEIRSLNVAKENGIEFVSGDRNRRATAPRRSIRRRPPTPTGGCR